jgi:hypothetical protein
VRLEVRASNMDKLVDKLFSSLQEKVALIGAHIISLEKTMKESA